MRYQIKKSLFFLLVILSILLLLYWILYDLGEAFYGIVKLQTTLDIRWLFRGDAIISPSIYTVVLFPFTFIVYLIFYRKECISGRCCSFSVQVLSTYFQHHTLMTQRSWFFMR